MRVRLSTASIYPSMAAFSHDRSRVHPLRTFQAIAFPAIAYGYGFQTPERFARYCRTWQFWPGGNRHGPFPAVAFASDRTAGGRGFRTASLSERPRRIADIGRAATGRCGTTLERGARRAALRHPRCRAARTGLAVTADFPVPPPRWTP